MSGLPAGDEDAALPASTRSCRRSAGVAGTAMLADRQSPTNVVGAIEARECGWKVVQATGAAARIRDRGRRSGGSGRSSRRRKQSHRKRSDSGCMLESLVEKCWCQRGVSRIFWSLDWNAQRFYLPHDPSTAGTPTSKRIGARQAGWGVTAQKYPMKISGSSRRSW